MLHLWARRVETNPSVVFSVMHRLDLVIRETGSEVAKAQLGGWDGSLMSHLKQRDGPPNSRDAKCIVTCLAQKFANEYERY